MSLFKTLPSEDQVLSGRSGPVDDTDPRLATDQEERADLAAYRRARRRARTRRLGTGALGLAVLAALWQVIAMLINDPVFLPSVSQTAAGFAH
jgi:ferric-dicitrate binding protein FerR (iron transport regulator)